MEAWMRLVCLWHSSPQTAYGSAAVRISLEDFWGLSSESSPRLKFASLSIECLSMMSRREACWTCNQLVYNLRSRLVNWNVSTSRRASISLNFIYELHIYEALTDGATIIHFLEKFWPNWFKFLKIFEDLNFLKNLNFKWINLKWIKRIFWESLEEMMICATNRRFVGHLAKWISKFAANRYAKRLIKNFEIEIETFESKVLNNKSEMRVEIAVYKRLWSRICWRIFSGESLGESLSGISESQKKIRKEILATSRADHLRASW